MLNIGGICVPLSLDCNLHCRYCFRDNHRLKDVSDFTPDMVEYLKSLTPKNCSIVTATGGEPLLHFDKVQQLFSYVHKDIHKKIITNGTLLTGEMVDYINQNNIELQLSHDGAITKYHRGVNVLDNTDKLNLICKVKNLTVTSVISKYNTDVWANFFYIAKKLNRTDFDYGSIILYKTPFTADLVKDFDYDTWYNTWVQFQCSKYKFKRKKIGQHRVFNFDVLPNGVFCANLNICRNYGSIHSKSFSELRDKLIELGDMDYCINHKCKYIDTCHFPPQDASDHLCKCRKMIMDNAKPELIEKIRQYVSEHISEIEQKYGYNRKDESLC